MHRWPNASSPGWQTCRGLGKGADDSARPTPTGRWYPAGLLSCRILRQHLFGPRTGKDIRVRPNLEHWKPALGGAWRGVTQTAPRHLRPHLTQRFSRSLCLSSCSLKNVVIQGDGSSHAVIQRCSDAGKSSQLSVVSNPDPTRWTRPGLHLRARRLTHTGQE